VIDRRSEAASPVDENGSTGNAAAIGRALPMQGECHWRAPDATL